jgi:integrase
VVSFPIDATPVQKSKRPRRPNGAGSIQELGAKGGAKSKKSKSCKWRAQYTDYLSPKNPKPRPSKQFKTYREAEKWLNDRVADQTRGFSGCALDSKMTISEFVENFILTRENKGRSPETIRNYKSNLKNQIAPRIGHLNASKISPHAIEAMFTSMRKDGLGRAAELSFAILNAAYKYAVRMGDLPFNPMQRIEKPKHTSVVSTAIEQEDLRRIYIAAMSSPYMHARVECAVVLGLRPCEALGLKWSDFDLDSSLPKVTISRKLQRVLGEGLTWGTTKNGKSLVKHLSSEQVKIFRKHKATQGLQKARWTRDYDLVFPNTHGLPKDDKGDTRDWKRLLDQAGVKSYLRYQSRKSPFSYIAPSVDIKTLQQYSGHAQASTLLNHYVHSLTPSMQKLLHEQDEFRRGLIQPAENAVEEPRSNKKFV